NRVVKEGDATSLLVTSSAGKPVASDHENSHGDMEHYANTVPENCETSSSNASCQRHASHCSLPPANVQGNLPNRNASSYLVHCTCVPGNNTCPNSQNTGIDTSEPSFTHRQAIPNVVTHRCCQNVEINSSETCSTQTEVSRIGEASSSNASNQKRVSQRDLPTPGMQGHFPSRNVRSRLMNSPAVRDTSICPNSQDTNVDTPEPGSTHRQDYITSYLGDDESSSLALEERRKG
ncbi:hypothetical protein Tco_1024259, partial [Tanacetum coccineum]